MHDKAATVAAQMLSLWSTALVPLTSGLLTNRHHKSKGRTAVSQLCSLPLSRHTAISVGTEACSTAHEARAQYGVTTELDILLTESFSQAGYLCAYSITGSRGHMHCFPSYTGSVDRQ